ncbi:hypothetical protein SADUNF_Sadunf14G0014600 [Salix dunnii]|uniref:NAC domain-containing protein n=1 Tax=Salix dunnii TaxID=1413687 RepID=A0A835JK32_9ROSI|nr:hypothetical protein SADUNF_Sadunf14G0014600 [Salix dunnii]
MEGNNKNPKTLSPSLPPGCRFYPSDEQLCYYLKNKNRTIPNDTDDVNGYDLIKELDLYDYDPFDLPENACYAYGYKARKRHWYCFTKEQVRVTRRKAKGGYWRRSGRVRDAVVGPGGKAVMCTRTRFVYYLGNSVKSAVRTGWVLYEYALVDHAKASFVLCRVFVKSRGGNSISENVVSSCAEESVSAVRTNGARHDGFLTPDIAEAKVHDDHVSMKNDLSRYSARLGRDFDDQVTARPTSISSFQFPSNSQCNEAVRRTSGTTDGNMYVDAETSQQLRSILEGDFIELDDLVD